MKYEIFFTDKNDFDNLNLVGYFKCSKVLNSFAKF